MLIKWIYFTCILNYIINRIKMSLLIAFYFIFQVWTIKKILWWTNFLLFKPFVSKFIINHSTTHQGELQYCYHICNQHFYLLNKYYCWLYNFWYILYFFIIERKQNYESNFYIWAAITSSYRHHVNQFESLTLR